MSETLFDLVDTPADTHAHTGEDCVFCATRTGTSAKIAATQAVTRDHAWWADATRWLGQHTAGYRFTADDLIAAIGKPTGSTNQIGARLRSWAMTEMVNPVGFTEAERPESHGRVLRVWEVAP